MRPKRSECLRPARTVTAANRVIAQPWLTFPTPGLPMGLDMEHSYTELVDIGRQISHHRQALARPRVEQLLKDRLDATTSNEALLAHLIAESLLRRIDQTLLESRNIYVETFDIPQIALFYHLARAVPFIGMGHAIANATMLNHVLGASRFTILDVGIGKGVQVQSMLSGLVQEGGWSPEHVRIVGVDPSPDNLAHCKTLFEELEQTLPFSLKWVPVSNTLERLSLARLRQVVGPTEQPLVINGAFSVHHCLHPAKDRALRTALLRRLAALNPEVLVLIEPHANHDAEGLGRRIHEAWHHFSSVFALIDESDESAATRFTIKETFFGREVRDIFGCADMLRCERHEPYDSWLLRLTRVGLQPGQLTVPELCVPRNCEVDVADGIVRLSYRETVVVAVVAYCPPSPPESAFA